MKKVFDFFLELKKNVLLFLLFNDKMGCPKLTYHLVAEPRLRCVYNAAGSQESYACGRKATFLYNHVGERTKMTIEDRFPTRRRR